ncbi:MAG TPA: hypothetical protein VFM05_06825, partial [Candidatus Saccharimonadales bacterium]|nr:hypothetical protein [Candidatus Saccharimonadales bacterium]
VIAEVSSEGRLLPSLALSLLVGDATTQGGQPMESFPSTLVRCIARLRPLFWAEVFERFCSLLTSLLMGEATYGTVCASALSR